MKTSPLGWTMKIFCNCFYTWHFFITVNRREKGYIKFVGKYVSLYSWSGSLVMSVWPSSVRPYERWDLGNYKSQKVGIRWHAYSRGISDLLKSYKEAVAWGSILGKVVLMLAFLYLSPLTWVRVYIDGLDCSDLSFISLFTKFQVLVVQFIVFSWQSMQNNFSEAIGFTRMSVKQLRTPTTSYIIM